jgi:proton-translocating NADH-quinone oxidoreductase chain N
VTLLSLLPQFLPEILLLAGALLVFLLDAAGIRRLELLGGISLGAIGLALLGVLADLGTSGLEVFRTLPANVVDVSPGATALYSFTSFGLVFQAVFLISAGLVALASLSRPSNEPGAAVFFGLLQTATLGMLLVATSADLIYLLLAIEITGISTYLMVGYPRRDLRSMEAAMKFYIVGALSTALSFFGASLLYGAYGGTSLALLAAPPHLSNLALFGYAFLIAGLGFKLTAVPFHAWAVDVYDGAPTDVSAFLAGGSKKIGIFAFFLVFIGPVTLLRLSTACAAGAVNCTPVPPHFSDTIQLSLGILAVVTMTVGNLLALMQREMKRMLAYSSISQAGYMLIGIAVGTAPALAGASFQILAHSFMKVGAFLVVAAAASLGVGPLIEDWRGLGQRRPGLGIAFALMLLSLAGIPLTVGFVSKFVLFSSAVQAEGFFVWLAVAGLLNSAISVFYYARVLKAMFLEKGPEAPEPLGLAEHPPSLIDRIGAGRTVAIGLCAVAIVALGVDPGPVLNGLQTAAEHFLSVGP